jgi:plastocyanin
MRRSTLATLVAVCAYAFTGAVWAQQPSTHKVDILSFKFIPEHLSVRVGDTILFVNKDLVPHTATAKNGSWDTEEIRGGSERAYVLERAGRFVYVCRYHPAMQAVIEVKP